MSARRESDRRVVVSLTEALLAGGWVPDELARRAADVVGSGQPWLATLIEEVLALFPEPPRDRPRELSEVVAHSEVLVAAAAAAWSAGTPLRAIGPRRPREPPQGLRCGLPPLRDLADVATWLELSAGQLSWLSDPNGLQLRTGPGPLHVYGYFWSARDGRPPRLLEAPRPILLRVQRQLLHRLLCRIPVHPAAHGFVPGRSVLTHARAHLGAEVVLGLDISNFFAQITAARVASILRGAGYLPPVAHALAGLCTTRTPGWALRQMPTGGTSTERYALRLRLRAPHLPQGAPSSPVLANLGCWHLDRRLSGYAVPLEATYGRYADDLSFSGGAPLRLAAPAFLRGVARIVADEGFPVHPGKTRVQTRSQRQVVTGLVVNERPNVRRRDYDQLRAVLHEARTRGPEAANRDQHPDFRRHLTGRVQWVESVNPGRGHRLRADLEAIRWPDHPPRTSAGP